MLTKQGCYVRGSGDNPPVSCYKAINFLTKLHRSWVYSPACAAWWWGIKNGPVKGSHNLSSAPFISQIKQVLSGEGAGVQRKGSWVELPSRLCPLLWKPLVSFSPPLSREQGFLSNNILAVLTTFYLKLAHQGGDYKGYSGWRPNLWGPLPPGQLGRLPGGRSVASHTLLLHNVHFLLTLTQLVIMHLLVQFLFLRYFSPLPLNQSSRMAGTVCTLFTTLSHGRACRRAGAQSIPMNEWMKMTLLSRTQLRCSSYPVSLPRRASMFPNLAHLYHHQ